MTEIVKTDDLVIEPAKLPMTKEETIELINETILKKNWSISDLADGREVEVFKEWHPFIQEIVWAYRYATWEVFHYLHGDREYLSFTNPTKRLFNTDRKLSPEEWV